MLDQNKPIDFTDMNTTTKADYYSCLKRLHEMLEIHLEEHNTDGFIHYLLGLVFLKLGNKNAALDSLCRAVRYQPLLWEAWDELSNAVDDRAMVSYTNSSTRIKCRANIVLYEIT